MSALENLIHAADLFKERGAVYKDNYKRAGAIFTVLFPDGVKLDSVESYNRMAIVMQIINKLLRYSLNWDKGHADSLHDITVYAAILKELDEEYLQC